MLMLIPITSTAWPCSSCLCGSPPPLLLPDHPAQCSCWPPTQLLADPPTPLHAHACPWWSPIFLATFMASQVCDAISQHTTRDICNFPVNFHIKENKPTMTKDWKISSATASKNFLLAKSVHFAATHIYHLCRQSWVGEEVIGIGEKVQKVKVKVKNLSLLWKWKKWNTNHLFTFEKEKVFTFFSNTNMCRGQSWVEVEVIGIEGKVCVKVKVTEFWCKTYDNMCRRQSWAEVEVISILEEVNKVVAPDLLCTRVSSATRTNRLGSGSLVSK